MIANWPYLGQTPTTSIYVLQKAHAAMQTVAMARGRLVGVKFWMSKQEVEISRIDDTGKAVRQMQWLITLDAEIDIAALLDGSDRPVPALALATEAASVLEGAAGGETDDVTEISAQEGQGSDANPPHEDDDLESQYRDLVSRLKLDNDEGALQLKAFATATFGRGWTKRPQDVRQFVQELRTALANPLAFREQVAAIAADVIP